jgi:ankyrin repeat protein
MQERQAEKADAARQKPRLPEALAEERLYIGKEMNEMRKRLNDGLWKAAAVGDNAEVKRLIRAGADVNAKDSDNRPALHYAAQEGHVETCLLLIGECAKSRKGIKEFIAAKDDWNQTALHRAAIWGHTQTCALIIGQYAKCGGDVNELIAIKTLVGSTALRDAADRKRTKTVQFLKSIELLADMINDEMFSSFMASFHDCAA